MTVYRTLTGNVRRLAGAVPGRDVRVMVISSVPKPNIIIDVDNGRLLIGDMKVPVDTTTGDFEIENLVDYNDETTNPFHIRYKVLINYLVTSMQNTTTEATWDSGWLMVTTNGDLSDPEYLPGQYAPPEYQSDFMAQANALLSSKVAEVEAIKEYVNDVSNISTSDAVITAIDSNPASAFRVQQDSRLSTSIAAQLGDVADPENVADFIVDGVVEAKIASGDLIDAAGLRDSYALSTTPVGSGVLGVGSRLVTLAGRGGGKHNAFPGLVRHPLGPMLGVWREANEHQVVVGPSNSHIKQSLTTDLGRTWSTPVTSFTVASTDDVRDPCLMMMSSGRVVMTYFVSTVDDWTHIKCFSRYSDDFGANWSTAKAMPFAFTSGGAAITSPCVEEDDGDLVAVAYGMNSAGTRREVRACRSTNDSATWADDGLVAAHVSRSFDEPFIGKKPDGDIMVLIRSDDSPENIYMVDRPDGGTTWSSPTVAFQGTGRPAWLATSAGHIVVTSRKLAGQQVTVTRVSIDGAGSWSPEIPVDDENLTCTYAQMVEVAPGNIATIFSAQPDNDSAYVKFGYIADGVLTTPLGDYVKPLVGFGPPIGYYAPYGQLYTDLNNTAGASTWVNKSDVFGTVWTVLEGDTGQMVVVEAGDNATLPDLRVTLQRKNGHVTVKLMSPAAAAAGAILAYSLPIECRPTNPAGVPTFIPGQMVAGTALPAAIGCDTDPTGNVYIRTISGQGHYGQIDFDVDRPWFATLPV